LLLALLLHRLPTSHGEMLDFLRHCPRRRDAALAIIHGEEFARANRDLLVLLSETRR